MARDPETLAHVEWLGYVQPVGLVVSIPALLSAQAHINRNIIPEHQRFVACLPRDKFDQPISELRDFAEFTHTVLEWRATDLECVVPEDPRYALLEVPLPEYHETLRPTHVVREHEPKDAAHPWMMLIQVLSSGTSFDDVATTDSRHWEATPHAKFERLLRETRVPMGLLVNGTHLRLVYSPRGETSGYATFSVAEMAQVAGRPIFAALHMLLCEERLFSLGEKQRLPAILADSRKYQNHVSEELAQQVLAALYELLRGFQAADEATKGDLLRGVLAEDPNHVYQGLLTVLMRLVFVLYAEDRGLISNDPVYANFYSVTGLFERLRGDAGRFPDTMDQRFGAWAQLLTLYRLVYEGGSHGGLSIPARKGYLFDPDRYNFLEGREWKTSRAMLDKPADVPRVSDGVVFRVLNNLLILDGERLSYRTLDVEQIGSVYETMMGFGLEVAQGRSIAIKPKKSHGAPTTINLETLLAVKPAERNKWLKAQADQEVSGQAATALKEAATVEDLLAALDKRIAKNVTPNVVAKGTMVFQPSDERRRSGSHYTPRSLTEPIVRTTLKPILEQLGTSPTPDQILALNVCDPAMGSGAFLVEVCRQLGDELVTTWHVHQCVPKVPPDEDELLFARRLVAQQCLYGVDKNQMAVDLSKLSLWLATLAKDHPFTFLDHSLRCGDSLVGLSREQIAAFHWQPPAKRAKDDVWFGDPIAAKMKTVAEYRQRILAARDDKPYEQLRQELDVADEALSLARLTGDCVIAAYFSGDKDKARVARLDALAKQLVKYISPQGKIEDRQPLTAAVASLHGGDHPLQPFHWQIEFPEVFSTVTSGFDAIVGNPPFLGGVRISGALGQHYLDYLKSHYVPTAGNSDLVSYFFRRSFEKLCRTGVMGLIATNSICQADTRRSGLTPICKSGGVIYSATRRLPWPGNAAVIVSVVHIAKSSVGVAPCSLDQLAVDRISAFLLKTGPDEDPVCLMENQGTCYRGVVIFGSGFILESEEANRLIQSNPKNASCVLPYLTGEDVNSNALSSATRFVIDFGTRSLEEAGKWPELLRIVEERVFPERAIKEHNAIAIRQKEKWWQFRSDTPFLKAAIRGLPCCLAISQVSNHIAFSRQPTNQVFGQTTHVFALSTWSGFACLQNRIHELWARFLGSSMKDDLRYNPSDCFDTFPFPLNYKTNAALELAGHEYHECRAGIMVRNNEGMTKTYNRFHNRDHDATESDQEIVSGIQRLRELHAAMDRAVLEAYGWRDLAQSATCKFLLDYEEDEDDEEESSGRRRKKPWRYRWPDDFRDEVLARLLALNAERAEQERLAGATAAGAKAPVTKPSTPRRSKGESKGKDTTAQKDLFQ